MLWKYVVDMLLDAPVSIDATGKGHQNTVLLPWWDRLPNPSVRRCSCVAHAPATPHNSGSSAV